jgi:glycosyltransferase involved in cell wall biosynthesis
MIVKNEEQVLERCLKSIKEFVNEIIIVDTGSTDKTKEIAAKFTDKIYDFEWVDDFSAARNFSFSKATMDYIIWLDADDVVEKTDLKKLLEIKNELQNVDVVMVKYNIAFDEKNNPTFSYYRERILKNDKTFLWVDPVHEIIVPHGKIIYSDAAISHRKNNFQQTDRNLKIYQKMINNNIKLAPRQKFYYSRELMYNELLDDAIQSFNEFLNDNGWVENKIETCQNLANCFIKKNDLDSALKSLFQSFIYDKPRAETLCSIGNIFMQQTKYEQAIFWFKQATKCKPNYESGAFIQKENYDLIPYLQMCVCYFHLNDLKKSEYYNQKAYKINPYNRAVQINREFFKNLKATKNKNPLLK